ncbi:MAG: right-handed parallel beta-helix repeat-containing protein [Planctomycetota bacterium]|nr:right-handed parallel beta-helix repeat-containing protein [Planctomycetota bacterium]
MPTSAAVCLMVLCLSVIVLGARAQEDFFVAPGGNDTWSGKLKEPNAARDDGPFATMQRAQKAVRDLKTAQPDRKGPLTVAVRGGAYFLTEPLVFTPEDSGTADAPVQYVALPNEQPLISGGVRLTGWKRDDKGRWQLEVPDVANGTWVFNQLFVNGQRRYRPRLPKDAYAFIAGEMAPSKPKAPGFDRFKFKAGDIKGEWKNLEDVEVLTFHNWFMTRFRVASVDDKARVIQFTGYTAGTADYAGLKQGWRYIVENVYEALEKPGEWYLDRKSGVLTYIPMPGEDPEKAEVIAPRIETLVQLKGDAAKKQVVQHIHFVGLTFSHTNWKLAPEGYSFCQAEAALGGTVGAVGTCDCVLRNCTVSHIGNYAVDFGVGCKRNRVENCELTDLGAGGVKIGEMQLRGKEEEIASHNTVTNCLIAYAARVHPAAIGVWIGHSPYNTVEHNEMYDFYYSTVSVGWSWGYGKSGSHHNTIAYNHMHKIGQGVLTDMGGIYTLGVSPGTVLHHNVMHDIESHSYGGWGIYFDEGSQGIVAENNIAYRTKSSGFHQHYGRENVVRNNIFAFGIEAQLMRSRDEPHLSFTFEQNIVYWKDAPLLGSNWNGDTKKFLMRKNLYWEEGGGKILFAGLSFEDWQAKRGEDLESIIADPLFVDPEHGNFALKPGSPAEKIGFQPIDTSNVGRLPVAGVTQTVVKELPRAFPPPPPPPPPAPIAEDFEEVPVGEKPPGAVVSEDSGVKEAVLRVTDETAASGKHSLKFTDAPGQKFPWDPHMWYEPRFKEGVMVGTFALRVEQGAVFFHEWRTQGHPYQAGPSLRVEGDGTLTAAGKKVATLPLGKWVRFEITAGLGKDAKGKWDLAVTLPDTPEPQKFTDLPCSPQFKSLFWLGFVAHATEKAVFYVDDITLAPKKP